QFFIGLRSDPFFFDGKWSKEVSANGIIPEKSGSNIMAKMNILTFAVELDRRQVFGGAFDLLAVAAEAYELAADGSAGKPLDRVGRPEITNVSLVARGGAPDLRDQYNQDAPFNIATAHSEAYRTRLAENIRFYDRLDDNNVNWTEPEIEKFTAVLVDDFLVLDITKPCKGNNYLEIERTALEGEAHQTCGGRELSDDVMDRIYNIYINNNQSDPVSDGVDKPGKPLLADFPYLAKPDIGPAAAGKAAVARFLASR
ncbi:MAG: DUF4331 family protein, partial [Pseudomonadota bacterium]